MEEKVCSRCGGNGPFPPHGFICKSCKKTYMQEWHRRNKEHVQQYSREYYAEHRQESAQQSAHYRAEHPEEMREYQRLYARKRRQSSAFQAYHREWQRNNAGRIAKYQRRSHKRRKEKNNHE